MSDEIIHENLLLISESLDVINKRFSSIKTPDDLVMDDYGVTILDSIAMRLQVVGELLKKIDKENSAFLKKHKEINWENIMRLRDIVSHHYEKVDHEIIFDICAIFVLLALFFFSATPSPEHSFQGNMQGNRVSSRPLKNIAGGI